MLAKSEHAQISTQSLIRLGPNQKILPLGPLVICESFMLVSLIWTILVDNSWTKSASCALASIATSYSSITRIRIWSKGWPLLIRILSCSHGPIRSHVLIGLQLTFRAIFLHGARTITVFTITDLSPPQMPPKETHGGWEERNINWS